MENCKTVLPILILQENHSKIESNRPKALTSVMGKILEKICKYKIKLVSR